MSKPEPDWEDPDAPPRELFTPRGVAVVTVLWAGFVWLIDWICT